ncbi:MAG TPA: hypothetical protein HA237_03650 [Candidatus Diapherotrites archaeon]|uniref:Uncharacterized protein n=1 Tax=Candidatus Iainarchaeum sp. TaxID=3101447 RepID=A0A7J4IUD4_9ARCH|nr:hypothetical protein [Candidatus Diapherotrites archaeon]
MEEETGPFIPDEEIETEPESQGTSVEDQNALGEQGTGEEGTESLQAPPVGFFGLFDLSTIGLNNPIILGLLALLVIALLFFFMASRKSKQAQQPKQEKK